MAQAAQVAQVTRTLKPGQPGHRCDKKSRRYTSTWEEGDARKGIGLYQTATAGAWGAVHALPW